MFTQFGPNRIVFQRQKEFVCINKNDLFLIPDIQL